MFTDDFDDGERCRVCGCSEHAACFQEGVACSWAEADLCSFCAAEGALARGSSSYPNLERAGFVVP